MMIRATRHDGLNLKGGMVAALLVGTVLTISPTAYGATYPARCHFACVDKCESERCYRRCTNALCRDHIPRRIQPQRNRSHRYRQPLNQLFALILRLLTDWGTGGLVGGALWGLVSVVRAIRRSHNLCIAEARRREASALEHKAADLRAEARRREQV